MYLRGENTIKKGKDLNHPFIPPSMFCAK